MHQPERPSPRIRRSSVSSSVISLMPHHLEISRKPPPTRNTNFPSSTLRCTTALRPLCISVLCVDVPVRLVVSVLPQRGSSLQGNKWSYVAWKIILRFISDDYCWWNECVYGRYSSNMTGVIVSNVTWWIEFMISNLGLCCYSSQWSENVRCQFVLVMNTGKQGHLFHTGHIILGAYPSCCHIIRLL